MVVVTGVPGEVVVWLRPEFWPELELESCVVLPSVLPLP